VLVSLLGDCVDSVYVSRVSVLDQCRNGILSKLVCSYSCVSYVVEVDTHFLLCHIHVILSGIYIERMRHIGNFIV